VSKPKEPERPPLSLVGTIASGDEGFGIFLDQSTKTALRLKVGEDYQGWKLRSVQGREAILEKDQEAVILALPEPGASKPAGDVGSPLSKAGKRPWKRINRSSPSRCRSRAWDKRPLRSAMRFDRRRRTLPSCCR
jgi:hypothetical protein